MPQASTTACTAAAAGLCCLLMGFGANFPLALASGMGLNAVVAFQVATAPGSWQAAMGLVVLDGLVVFLLVLSGLREAILHAREATGSHGAGPGAEWLRSSAPPDRRSPGAGPPAGPRA